MALKPYLFFNGRCEEALEFYKRALGAEVEGVLRYKDSPEPPPPGKLPRGSEDKVMHAAFRVGGSVVWASDGNMKGKPRFQGFSLAVEAKDEADARRKFTALARDGEVRMPLGKTFYAKSFGMVTDRFGVDWMVIVPLPASRVGKRLARKKQA